MCLLVRMLAISSTGVSSRNVITFRVMTSLTGINAGSLFEECSHRLQIGVAPAQDQPGPPLRQLAGKMSRQRQRSGGFERQMEPRPGDLNGAGDLFFGHGDDLVHQSLGEHDLEVTRSDGGGTNAVSQG